MTLASQLLVASIPLLINLYTKRYQEQDKLKAFLDKPLDFNLPVGQIFDFIIVGGGTAGCVLARRLVDADFSVLIIEAGGNPPPLQAIQLASSFTYSNQDISFVYQSTPQKNAGQKRIYTTAGKMMGGGSSHHDMVYERGHPRDYNEWAVLTGDRSWRYERILKYFKKAEKYMGKFTTTLDQHGQFGPMTVSRPISVPGRKLWLKAGEELGYKVIDSNGPQQIGFSPKELNHEFGRRVSTYSGYVQPIEKRGKSKLTIHRYAVASKVLIKNKRAVGVEYTHHAIPRIARARKEVILSSGSYSSPILLIKSGIGPADQLKAAKVDPVAILPVGENLMDHTGITVAPIDIADPSLIFTVEQNLTFKHFSEYINEGEGPLLNCFYSGGEAFISSSRAINIEKKPDWPDLQIFFGLFRNKIEDPLACFFYLARPFSRGRLTLNTSATAMDDNFLSIIDYNVLSNKSDIDVAIEGVKFCLNVIENTPSFQRAGARFTTRSIPECTHLPFRSDNYWKCYIRNGAGSANHASGTCRMGKKKDKRSVVDSKFRVINVRRLRVVDASIMPVITNANIAAPVVMFGEKAAAEIIRQYRRKIHL